MATKNEKEQGMETKRQAALEELYGTPEGRMKLEMAAAFIQEMQEVSDTAPYGKILDHVEMCAVVQGRKFLRELMERTLQEKVEKIDSETPRICKNKKEDGTVCNADIRNRGKSKKKLKR